MTKTKKQNNLITLWECEVAILNKKTEIEPDPVEWIEGNIVIPENSTYARKGPVKLDEFEKYIIRKTLGHLGKKPNKIYIRSSVQIGKSFICEMIMCYLIRWRSANIMLCYATAQIVKRVLKERIIPLIRKNFPNYLTGKEDDLSQEYITLKNGTIRFATAESTNTIASFSVPFVIASECKNYPNKEADIKQLLDGRTTQFREAGNYLQLYESSPKNTDDTFGLMCADAQVYLYPFFKLPDCNHWVFLEDRIIRGIVDTNGKTIQDPHTIRSNLNNAWIECPVCKCRYYENDHARILRGECIWAASANDIVDDKQPIYDYDEICFNHLNKLLNPGYTFVECLAEYFKAKNAIDPIPLQTYQNETMGREVNLVHEQDIFEQQIENFKIIRQNYTIYSKESYVPQDVKYLLLGGDTQGTGVMYIVVRGFVGNGSATTYLIDHAEIPFLLTESNEEIYQRYYQRTFGKTYTREDGLPMKIIFGLQDSGGHNADLVYYLTSRISNLKPYKGSSKGEKAPLVEKSDNNNIIFGNVDALSQIVNHLMYNCNFFFPADLPENSAYIQQLCGEAFIKKVDQYKIEHIKRIVKPNNHYRSAENYCICAAMYLKAFEKESEMIDRLIEKYSNFGQFTSNNAIKKQENFNLASVLRGIITQESTWY